MAEFNGLKGVGILFVIIGGVIVFLGMSRDAYLSGLTGLYIHTPIYFIGGFFLQGIGLAFFFIGKHLESLETSIKNNTFVRREPSYYDNSIESTDRDRDTDRTKYPVCPNCKRILEFSYIPKTCPFCDHSIPENVKFVKFQAVENRRERGVENDITVIYMTQCQRCGTNNRFRKKLNRINCRSCNESMEIQYDINDNPYLASS
ncbi:MAG: hypothetical protein ACMUIG_08645 [Thermoplasmatota archaeon]